MSNKSFYEIVLVVILIIMAIASFLYVRDLKLIKGSNVLCEERGYDTGFINPKGTELKCYGDNGSQFFECPDCSFFDSNGWVKK